MLNIQILMSVEIKTTILVLISALTGLGVTTAVARREPMVMVEKMEMVALSTIKNFRYSKLF